MQTQTLPVQKVNECLDSLVAKISKEGAAEEKAFQQGRKKYKTYKKKKQVRKRAAQKK